MDKTPFQNEDASSVEPEKVNVDNAVIVEINSIDIESLPQKKELLDSEKKESHVQSEKQPLDDDWLLLTQDWQNQPYEKTDIQALLKQTSKRTLLAKLLLLLDITATLGLFITLFFALYQGDWETATVAYLTFGSIGSLIFVYYEIKIRLHSWQHCCDSPDKAVANAISGIESSISYIQLTKLSCYCLLPAINWYLYAMIEKSEKSPWPAFIAANSIILVMWAITQWFYLKRNRELIQLRSV
jgi:hypothetical protein